MTQRSRARLVVATLALGVIVVSCNGTTGDELITFSAYAAGKPGAIEPFYTFDSSGAKAYKVQLTRASMYIGALYFDESPPSTGFDTPECITPDIYAGQVPGGLEVNLLSSTPQLFTTPGNGSADTALSWDIWLTNGDINATANLGVHIVDLQGVATRLSDKKPFTFAAIVTINAVTQGPGARLTASATPGLPGQYPICKERILALDLPNGLPFFQGGTLNVTIDPTQWFKSTSIDFADGLEAWDSADCQADTNASATYENGDACTTDSDCTGGFVCNFVDRHCTVQFCIPDTNNPTDTSVSAAEDFFFAIQGGGSEAYGVSYSL
jgi:hypothetical protein